MLVSASPRGLLRISATGDFKRARSDAQIMIQGLRVRLIDEPVCREDSNRGAERARLSFDRGVTVETTGG